MAFAALRIFFGTDNDADIRIVSSKLIKSSIARGLLSSMAMMPLLAKRCFQEIFQAANYFIGMFDKNTVVGGNKGFTFDTV